MGYRRFMPVLLLVALAGCELSPTSSNRVAIESGFQSGTDEWVAGFADYPVGDEEIYDLQFERRSLPAPLDTTRKALFLAGSNRSDDLFMFLKRPVDGLVPGAEYRVRFAVEIATNEGSGCMGIGGAPGEAVYLKAAATTAEPTRVVEDGYYRMSVDKGNQSTGSRSAVVLGDVANGSDECSEGAYRLKKLEDRSLSVDAAADASGRLWLLVGTDSGYEGITRLYYTQIRAELSRR